MANVLNKSELIANVANRCDYLEDATARQSAQTILDIMTGTLCQKNRIEVRGFGTFSVKHRTSRQSRNPKTGETVNVPAVYLPYFKPSKQLVEQLNDD